jgi:aldehyde dehydrogenase (NAD+)
MVETFAAIAKGMPVGDALDPATMIGPMASSRHRDRVEGYVRTAREEGARLITGGGRPEGRGWFVEPTVFADVSNDQPIAREEAFGPVLSVIPYDGEEDLVRIANDSEYGLGGSVWTSDAEHGTELARRIQTGTIGVNHYLPDPAASFGGVTGSGLGRELGPEGLTGYQQLQSIYLPPPSEA